MLSPTRFDWNELKCKQIIFKNSPLSPQQQSSQSMKHSREGKQMCESFVLGQRSLRGNPLDTQRLAGEKGLRASRCAWKLHRWSAPVASKREIPLPVKYNELFITLPCFYFFRSNNFPFFLFIFWEFQPADHAPELTVSHRGDSQPPTVFLIFF